MKQASCYLLCASVLVGASAASPATTFADTSTGPHQTKLGIGYKMGNGAGFTGVDLIVSPIRHLSFELQGSWLTGFDSGYAILPGVIGELHTSGSTPYLKAGVLYVAATLGDVSASGTGGFANIGYEWKWQSGFGIQLGGGDGYNQEVKAVTGDQTVSIGGKVNPNLEIGLRYRF